MDQVWWFVTQALPWVIFVAAYGAVGSFTAGHVEVWMKKHSSAAEDDRDKFSVAIGALWPVLIPMAVFYLVRVGIDPQTKAEKRSEQIERDQEAELREQKYQVERQYRTLQAQAMTAIQSGLLGIESGNLSAESKALEDLKDLARTGALPDERKAGGFIR